MFGYNLLYSIHVDLCISIHVLYSNSILVLANATYDFDDCAILRRNGPDIIGTHWDGSVLVYNKNLQYKQLAF